MCQNASKQLGMWPGPSIQLPIRQGSHQSRTNGDEFIGLCSSVCFLVGQDPHPALDCA